MKWQWIDKQLLVMLHDESLLLHGGASGIRDEGLLDSALDRPLNLAAVGLHFVTTQQHRSGILGWKSLNPTQTYTRCEEKSAEE